MTVPQRATSAAADALAVPLTSRRRCVDGVAFAVLVPPSSVATCVAFQGYGARLDAFELQRFAAIAVVTKSTVVVVETPGIGTSGTGLSTRERSAALRGDYEALATRMIRPVLETLEDGRPVHLLGYSMGASLAVAAGAAAPGRVGSMTLVEPVGLRRRRGWALARAVRAEDGRLPGYLEETAAVRGAVDATNDRPPRSRPDQAVLAWGLTRGCLAGSLDALPSNLRPVVVRGSESRVCRADDVAQVHGRARVQIVSGGHALWHSLPRVVTLAGGWAHDWTST